MELWIWAAVAGVGQAFCVAGLIVFARAHPRAAFPYWIRPQEQPRLSRVFFAAGFGLTFFGAFATGSLVGEVWLRLLIVVGVFIPVLVGTAIINARAASRRKASSNAAGPSIDNPRP